MKRLFITGGRGFIGKNLIEAWQGRYSIEAPSSQDLDLLDMAAVERYLAKNRFDAVVHCAKIDEVYRADATAHQVLDGNLRMFYNLERCHDLYGKLLYFGSGAEYDRLNMPPMVQESDFGANIPQDPYGFSKYIMARTAEDSKNIYDLRLFAVYGKYEDYHRRFISNNICRVLSGGPMTLRKNARFDYLFISDLCNILTWFVENTPKYHVYNVCRGQPVELCELAELINEAMGMNTPLMVQEAGYQRDYTARCDRLLEELPDLTFRDHLSAIEELCHFYQVGQKFMEK